ncbi:MAG: tRNA modification GTPase [Gemmataceae bacterium]
MMDTRQTIVALATPPGPAARAIVRLSGTDVRTPLRAVFDAELTPGAAEGDAAGMPAAVYYWRGPHSYTGQDLAEVHVPGCAPLVDVLVGRLIAAGCRPAGPGEFTQRAFLAGKLDLTRAEAVHAVIAAEGRRELRAALGQLAGGVARPMAELRSGLLDLLADLEAGLDFADEDVSFVTTAQLLTRLGAGMARLTLVQKQLDGRSLAGSAYRVALAGVPNAGKSSLFNALAGAAALVSASAGTTRDYLTARLELGGLVLELIDTPGLTDGAAGIDADAQALGGRQHDEADLVAVCVESGRVPGPAEARLLGRGGLAVATKCDLREAAAGWLATSARTRAGLRELRAELLAAARRREEPALASSAGRCRGHVAAALAHLRAAHALALDEGPAELTALEVRLALEEVGHLAGAVYTDDLLDRVFARFCIGK